MAVIPNSRCIDLKNRIQHQKNNCRYKTTAHNAGNFCQGIDFHCLFKQETV